MPQTPKTSIRNVNELHHSTFSPLDRLAIAVTDHVGTMGFFLIIFVWTFGWLGWNLFGPREWRFDPYPAFVMWLFISNTIQIMLMPLIMVGQNLQGRHAELRAESDFQVNRRSEREIQEILTHLRQQTKTLERLARELKK